MLEQASSILGRVAMGRHSLAVLGGVAIATTFFLPIAAAGHINASLLMWTPRHTVELACAWLALAWGASTALVWFSRDPRPRRQSILLLLLVAPSALSLFAVAGRNGGLAESDSVRIVAIGAAIVVMVVAGVVWVFRPDLLVKAIRCTLPFGVLLLPPAIMQVGALSTERPVDALPPAERSSVLRSSGPLCESVYVLIFDELGYDAVFHGGQATLSSIGRMATSARVYHNAVAPTESTETSIAAYLSVSAGQPPDTKMAARGPMGVARSIGLKTEVVGWYIPYCEMLGSYADLCKAYSMYNASTLYDRFNPFAPFVTVLNIWPYQLPTGFLKRPAAVWLHKAELEAIIHDASAPPSRRPVLRWVHFNVPHVPWLRNTGVLAIRAFDNTRDRYFAQLDEVDRALSTVLRSAESDDHIIVVVTADHGSRRGHAGDHLHVPLIVWHRGWTREDVLSQVRVRDVLDDIIAGACRD